MTERLVYLQVTTWAASEGGFYEHFYGRLKADSASGYAEHELKHPMTLSQVRKRNKQERKRGFAWKHKVGDLTNAFWSREELYAAARKEYRQQFPAARMLVVGWVGVCSPIPILDCVSKKKMRQGNRLVEEWDAVEQDGTENDKWDELSSKWDRLVESLR